MTVVTPGWSNATPTIDHALAPLRRQGGTGLGEGGVRHLLNPGR